MILAPIDSTAPLINNTTIYKRLDTEVKYRQKEKENHQLEKSFEDYLVLVIIQNWTQLYKKLKILNISLLIKPSYTLSNFAVFEEMTIGLVWKYCYNIYE